MRIFHGRVRGELLKDLDFHCALQTARLHRTPVSAARFPALSAGLGSRSPHDVEDLKNAHHQRGVPVLAQTTWAAIGTYRGRFGKGWGGDLEWTKNRAWPSVVFLWRPAPAKREESQQDKRVSTGRSPLVGDDKRIVTVVLRQHTTWLQLHCKRVSNYTTDHVQLCS